MNFVPIGVPDHFHRLTRVLCPRIDHGHEDPFNGKLRVDLPADLADRPDQLLQPVQGELCRLDGLSALSAHARALIVISPNDGAQSRRM